MLLIATDLASEGLDLQDADAIVHFDLPWTPLRLSQRLGRVARLGSLHERVRVWWFVPPSLLARRLGVERRIEDKVRVQLGLGVASTSAVGHAQVTNDSLAGRHRLTTDAAGAGLARVGFAVVRGRDMAAFAISWSFPHCEIPELVILHGDPPQRITDYRELESAMESLQGTERTEAAPPVPMLASLQRLIRARVAASERGPQNASSRALVRLVLQRARQAGNRREPDQQSRNGSRFEIDGDETGR